MSNKPSYEELEQRIKTLEKSESKRKQSEESLRDSNAMNSAMIENVGDVIGIIGADGMFKYQSTNVEKYFGWKPEEMIGTISFEKVHPEDIERMQKEFAKVLEKETFSKVEFRLKCKDGNYKWVEVTAVNRVKDPTINGVLVNYHDISERKRSEFVIKERLKELNCFYGISKIMQTPDISIEEIIRKVINIIPTSWQYPEITVCRIILDGIEYKEPNFKKTNWVQGSDIKVADKNVGIIEIYNLVKMPDCDEGPFLKEERMLLDVIAEQMGHIVEKKLVEEALKESVEKFRAIYDNAPLSYQSLNEDGSFNDINPTWLSTLGYERNEIIGKFYKDFLHPDGQSYFEENFPKLKKSGYVKDVQFKIRHKDGHYLYIALEGRIGYNPDGSFKYTYCVFQDITEKKKAEDALKESEEKYRTLSFNIPGMIYRAGTDWSTQVITNSEEVCGYSIDEWEHQKMDWRDLIHPDDKLGVIEGGSKLTIKPISIIQEYRIISKAGKTRWVSDHKTSFFKDDGSFYGVDGIVFDITERKQAEEKLIFAKEHAEGNEIQLNAILENSPTGFAINHISTGAVTYVNKAFTDAYLVPIELCSTVSDFFEYVYGDQLDVGNKLLEDVESGIPERMKWDVIPITDKKTKNIHYVTASNIVLKELDLMISTVIDITSQINNEKELKFAIEKVEENEALKRKMVANIGDVIVIIDHEGINRYKSPNVEKLFGWKPEELVGSSALGNVHPDDLDDAQRFIESLVSEPGKVGTTELRYRHKDGHYSWIEFTGSNMLDDPDIQGLLGNYHDITERKLAEDEFKKKVEELEVFHRLSVGRELKMIELKQEINKLSAQFGIELPYKLDFLEDINIKELKTNEKD